MRSYDCFLQASISLQVTTSPASTACPSLRPPLKPPFLLQPLPQQSHLHGVVTCTPSSSPHPSPYKAQASAGEEPSQVRNPQGSLLEVLSFSSHSPGVGSRKAPSWDWEGRCRHGRMHPRQRGSHKQQKTGQGLRGCAPQSFLQR